METVNTPPAGFFDRFNNWIKESVTVKLLSIGFLILILLIPQSWIESLIHERQGRAADVVSEIAMKWSEEQVVSGPILVVPFLVHTRIDKGKDGFEITTAKENAFFLPEELNIDGKVNPQILHRGIFESAVYESSLAMQARFLLPDFKKLNIAPEDVQWKEARLVLGLSDLRGISENPKLTMGGKILSGEPSNNISIESRKPLSPPADQDRSNVSPATVASQKGIVIRLGWNDGQDFASAASLNVRLKGSTLLYFTPVGKTTNVTLQGAWGSPGFDGAFLPASREITPGSFKAGWKVLHYNRPFSQEWIGHEQDIAGSEFGVRLLIPVDQYQKSIRTAKYGVLVIFLTFISLFMVEIIKKIRIHPFQYILIGAAMIIYYSLLLSFSEQMGFDIAYIIATVATIALITLYSISFLRNRPTIVMFGTWMTMFYGFIYVIIRQEDYSLMIGSVGLFLVIAAIMYFSRGIKWYGTDENHLEIQ